MTGSSDDPTVISGSGLWETVQQRTTGQNNEACDGLCIDGADWKSFLDSIVLIEVNWYRGSLQISGITFTDSAFPALQFNSLNNQEVTIDNCNFERLGEELSITNDHVGVGEIYTTFGAGIRAEYFDFATANYVVGKFTITNSRFSSNVASYAAGAYLLMGDMDVNLTDVIFENNKGQSQGGGLWISMEETAISSSWAWTGGQNRGTLTMNRCTFYNNYIKPAIASDTGVGGAMFMKVGHADAYLDECNFTQNRAATAAGALYSNTWYLGRIYMQKCWFEQNTMIHDHAYTSVAGAHIAAQAFVGGAWFSEGQTICDTGTCGSQQVDIHSTTFYNNSALEGASIYLYGAVYHNFSDCLWRSNQGMTLTTPGYLDDHSDISSLKTRGAVLYFGALAMNVSFRHCVMTDNRATESSAISIRQTNFKGSLMLENTTVTDHVESASTFRFKNIPRVAITLLRSFVNGSLEVSSYSQLTMNYSNVYGTGAPPKIELLLVVVEMALLLLLLVVVMALLLLLVMVIVMALVADDGADGGCDGAVVADGGCDGDGDCLLPVVVLVVLLLVEVIPDLTTLLLQLLSTVGGPC